MNELMGQAPANFPCAPPGDCIPSDWSEGFIAEVSQELRRRLMGECAQLHTTDSRRDWLLHMTLQAHHLPTLMELISEFNHAQLRDPGEGFEQLELRLHELGFFLKKKPLTAL